LIKWTAQHQSDDESESHCVFHQL